MKDYICLIIWQPSIARLILNPFFPKCEPAIVWRYGFWAIPQSQYNFFQATFWPTTWHQQYFLPKIEPQRNTNDIFWQNWHHKTTSMIFWVQIEPNNRGSVPILCDYPQDLHKYWWIITSVRLCSTADKPKSLK